MKIFKGLLLLVLFGFLGTGIGFAIFRTNISKLSEIAFQGAAPETESRLRKLLHSKIGDNFWTISVDDEAAQLKTDSWVQDVQITRRLPGTLIISITERRPFAALNTTTQLNVV